MIQKAGAGKIYIRTNSNEWIAGAIENRVYGTEDNITIETMKPNGMPVTTWGTIKDILEKYEEVIIEVDGKVTQFLSNKERTERDYNLLEIKLKDMDSVPEVYYKGERVFDKRLVSVDYQWSDDSESLGKQLINITGYDIDGRNANKIPSLDTISHKRIGE